jgi:hypothetical protein
MRIPGHRLLLSCVSALLAGIALPHLLPARTSQPARYAKRSSDQTATFRIPPVRIPLNIKGQPVTIAASAVITLIRQEHGQNILKLELSADLADLQQNMPRSSAANWIKATIVAITLPSKMPR